MPKFPSNFPMVPCASYDAATTGAELAESISKSLAKKAVAYALDGTCATCPIRSAEVRQRRDRHPRRSARAGTHPPRCGACAGRGRAGAVAGHAGDDRPGHRERLLLRLRPQRALHARRLPGHREEDARDHRPQQALHQGGLVARQAPRRSSPTRARATRSSWSMPSPRTRTSRSMRRATGSTSAAARTWPRRARSATPSS